MSAIHREPSYYSPLSLRLEGFNAGVPDDMITLGNIASVDEIGGSEFAAVPEVNRFAAIQAMDADAKGRLLALLVARQINGGQSSGMRRDRRHQRFDQIAFTSGVDMVAKWQAPVAFYDRLKKPVIAKIMTEVLGKSAADNCAKMKKGELAAAAVERMAGRGWLPPALLIVEPPAEVAQGACHHDQVRCTRQFTRLNEQRVFGWGDFPRHRIAERDMLDPLTGREHDLCCRPKYANDPKHLRVAVNHLLDAIVLRGRSRRFGRPSGDAGG